MSAVNSNRFLSTIKDSQMNGHRVLSLLTLLLAGSVLVGWHSLLSTLRLAMGNEEYTHILLILPISFTLICADWKLLRQTGSPFFAPGLFLLCAACAIAGMSQWQTDRIPKDLHLSISMLALVIWWIGTIVLCFGSGLSRRLLFPLCFLFWMVPFPAFVLNGIIGFLQQGSASVANFLFSTTGVPVSQDGLKLSIPGLTVEVAKECSSIRSSLMLLVTTMVLAQLMLRSPWRKALAIAAAVPLSVAKNGLRIYTIAMLGTRVDRGYLTGRLHHHGGIIFFAAALVVVFLLLWVLRHPEEEHVAPERVSHQGVVAAHTHSYAVTPPNRNRTNSQSELSKSSTITIL